jgi:hypothetical protein
MVHVLEPNGKLDALFAILQKELKDKEANPKVRLV